MPAMGVLIERLAISALFLYYSKNIDLPVVCKKLSCPQGNSRRGALIGAGADGCSADERCKSVARRVTRENVMMEDLIVIPLGGCHDGVFKGTGEMAGTLMYTCMHEMQ